MIIPIVMEIPIRYYHLLVSGIAWITASSSASGTEILSQQASTPYYITASDVTSGVSTAGFIDTTIVAKDGNIGIGTDNPTVPLYIKKSTPTIKLEDNVGSFDITTNTAGEGILRINNASSLRLFTDNTERMRINGAGDVGIGTNNPGANLDIAETGFVNVKIRTTGNNSATLNLQNSQRNFSVNNVSAGALTIYDSNCK